MHIGWGHDRVVFVFPNAGFVIKIPNPKVSLSPIRKSATMLRENWVAVIRYREWRFAGYLFEDIGRAVRQSVRGIICNRKERALFLSLEGDIRQKLLAPTRLSIWGLVNVQAYREPSCEKGHAIKTALRIASGEEDAIQFVRYDDRHHLQYSGNFHIADDRTVVFLDYGDDRTQQLITDHGERIATSFSLEAGRRQEREYRALIRRQNTRLVS